MKEKLNELDTKSEQAKELGIELPKDGYWGNTSSKVCGMVGGAEGGNFTKNAVQSFEEMLSKRNK
ncbi:small, acid-soluble spore protein, alpha/beta type [Clostridium sp. YIM B02505]|uniref:Small, acid-soluble spore protein, alpha/beta type n=1 Tax=Clostridium yunnanense TaxID=2800325 RepID=A0ABS1EM43_9CLOT|nr:alpha/beta-type small acid-soluble spore protein [Clostridium yunnanense]MBK1810417.1 small, acid-soluble spore protein, alpha/beta type [Clostridium yunnanense]